MRKNRPAPHEAPNCDKSSHPELIIRDHLMAYPRMVSDRRQCNALMVHQHLQATAHCKQRTARINGPVDQHLLGCVTLRRSPP